MKQRVEEMEREANKLRELQAAAAESNNAEGGEGVAGEAMETDEDKSVADSRSVFVGNVSTIELMGSYRENLTRLFSPPVRLTMELHQRRSKDTSSRAAQ